MTATGDSPVVKQHSRYGKELLKSLSKEELHLCSRKIPCASLLMLVMSPSRYLLASQVDQALITMTGFDGVSFTSLLQKFAPLFDDYTPFNTSHILLKQDFSKRGCSRCTCLDMYERVPNGVAVVFGYAVLQSLHVFALRLPRDH